MLVRFAIRLNAPPDPAQDRRFVGKGSITVGRAPDNLICLSDSSLRSHHAVLHETERGLEVRAQPGSQLVAGGARTEVVRLEQVADSVGIGRFAMTLAARDPATGESVVVLAPTTSASEAEATLVRRYAEFFAGSPVAVKKWSWLCGVAIFLVFLVLPLAATPWRTVPPATPVPMPGSWPNPMLLWTVGTLSRAHSSLGSDCGACHQSPFVSVRSAACLVCHSGIGQHADPHVAAGVDLRRQQCSSCHMEHRGTLQSIASDQEFCTDCHATIRGIAAGTKLLDVDDFATHPQFAPSLVADAVTGLRRRIRLGTPDDPKLDDSGVRFPHAKHLKAEGIKGPDGAVKLDCGSCHQPDSGGRYMAPVRFEENCRSCHQLRFEPKHPEWQLPHGQAYLIGSAVAGFYSAAILNGEHFTPERDALFAKPGADTTAPPDSPTSEAVIQAAAALSSSIARSTCGACHTVEYPVNPDDLGGWRVRPVLVPNHFMLDAQFSHAKHANMRCSACHAAKLSDGGPLALLPDVNSCRTCHAGEGGAPRKVASTCISCHLFHNSDLPLVAGPHHDGVRQPTDRSTSLRGGGR